MPPNTVMVSRPSKWGNPFKIDNPSQAEQIVEAYRVRLTIDFALSAIVKKELVGKNLACWCNLSDPCHADVLLEIANT